MITVYLMSYRLDGRRVWFSQSMDQNTAIQMRDHFKELGRRPRLYRRVVRAKRLLGC